MKVAYLAKEALNAFPSPPSVALECLLCLSLYILHYLILYFIPYSYCEISDIQR